MEKRQKFPKKRGSITNSLKRRDSNTNSLKRRGRVTESLDEFLKCIKDNCSSTIDPAPRKRGRPSESLEISGKFQYYGGPFSKRGRPAINLVSPGYIAKDQLMKESDKEEILEVSQERSPSPEIVKDTRDMQE